MRTRSLSPTVLVGLLLALSLLAGGCGGGGDADDEAAPTPSEAVSASPSVEPGPSSPSLSPSPSTGAAYLPVPDGVVLTEPGTRLRLEDHATAAWEPRQDLVGVVDVSVRTIVETTVQASLAGFDLTGPEQRSTPYFVDLSVGNVGETDLGGRQVPVYFLADNGILVAPTGVAPNFRACPGATLPGVFAPGDRTKSCLIFLVPEGARLQSITFRPPEGVVPLQWFGRVRDLDETSSGAGDRRGGRGEAEDSTPRS